MSLTLAFSIIGIGLLDSINPSLFIAQLYLLTTVRPVPRVLAYIAGGVLAYFVGGIFILTGARSLLAQWLEQTPATTLYSLQVIAGFLSLAYGLIMKTDATGTEAQKPKSLSLPASFMLGIVIIGNELTTALPYFIAIEQIAQAKMSLPQNLMALVLYNLIFSLPLFAFLLIFLVFRQQWAGIIEKINRAIQLWMPRIMKWLLILFGIVLIWDAAGFFLSGSPIFG